jgi:hypothetical protein
MIHTYDEKAMEVKGNLFLGLTCKLTKKGLFKKGVVFFEGHTSNSLIKKTETSWIGNRSETQITLEDVQPRPRSGGWWLVAGTNLL